MLSNVIIGIGAIIFIVLMYHIFRLVQNWLYQKK
jgi:hypothetical protein